MKAKKPRGTDDALGHLMKSVPEPNYCNEYILCVFWVIKLRRSY